ncbi:MAG: 50S ribosomal protein L11 methyltransferase [Desulfobacterales bacterium]|nr:50S ribosomal protein L11 methyltransferase [Desulfobacterales bacterium]
MPASSIQHRPAKTWNKIIIEADSRMTEAVAAYLADLSGSGVEISSSEGDLINDIDNPAAFEKITTYISIDPSDSENETISKKINELKQFLANLPLIFTECPAPKFFTEMIMEEDWGKAWKSFFTSFQITPKLTIKPSWEKTKKQSQEDNGEHIIEMDPGLAFGTGHHASTQMALLLLEELYQSRTMKLEKVLDVGTGSGILAMGCGLFGAINVLAIDNDPDAVETAKRNIIRNRLEDIITVSDQDIASIESGFNLIVANIIHDTLAEMAKLLTGLLAPKGYLILSGILKGDQENSIREIYTGQGLSFIEIMTKDEWAALQFQKN